MPGFHNGRIFQALLSKIMFLSVCDDAHVTLCLSNMQVLFSFKYTLVQKFWLKRDIVNPKGLKDIHATFECCQECFS